MKQKHPTDLLYNDAQLEVAKFFSCNSKGSPQLLLLLVVLVIRKEQLKRFWRALQNTSSQGCNYSEGNSRKCRYANTTHKTLKIHERPHISAKVFLDFLFHVILFSMFSPNKKKKKIPLLRSWLISLSFSSFFLPAAAIVSFRNFCHPDLAPIVTRASMVHSQYHE